MIVDLSTVDQDRIDRIERVVTKIVFANNSLKLNRDEINLIRSILQTHTSDFKYCNAGSTNIITSIDNAISRVFNVYNNSNTAG